MPFSIDDPEFDLSKFSGRLNSFLKIMNPLDAFYSNKQIKEFQKLIEDQKEKEKEQMAATGTRKVMVTREEIRKLRTA